MEEYARCAQTLAVMWTVLIKLITWWIRTNTEVGHWNNLLPSSAPGTLPNTEWQKRQKRRKKVVISI